MIAAYGRFTITIDELFGSGEKVYARWTQHGHQVGPVDGAAPTGAPVTQVTSAVYRVHDGLIAEYWIQIDRHGLRMQLAPGTAMRRSALVGTWDCKTKIQTIPDPSATDRVIR